MGTQIKCLLLGLTGPHHPHRGKVGKRAGCSRGRGRRRRSAGCSQPASLQTQVDTTGQAQSGPLTSEIVPEKRAELKLVGA